jgi:hypothetical protein
MDRGHDLHALWLRRGDACSRSLRPCRLLVLKLRRLQRQQHDAKDHQEWPCGPSARADNRGEWTPVPPAIIRMMLIDRSK